jgi:hypothetical protein
MLCLFVVWLLINLLASLNGVLLIDLLSIIIKKNLKIPKEEYESVNQSSTIYKTYTLN